MERGIIITPPFDFDGTNLRMRGGFSPTSLRQYLLYWDKIDWPENRFIGFGDSPPDIAFLEQCGVLSRTRVELPGFSGNIGKALIQAQHTAFVNRNRAEPGAWSLAQQTDRLASPEHETVQSRFLEVELYAAIPVPTKETALQDILEFKARRRDELLQLRVVMDEMYQQTIAAADVPRARLQSQSRLERALTDLNAVYAERFNDRLLSSLKVELNVPTLAGMAIVGGATASSFGLPLALGAAAGAIAAAVKFDLKHARRAPTIPPELKAYAYLHSIHEELGG